MGITDITVEQLELLRELAWHGGVILVSSRDDYWDYRELMKRGLVYVEETGSRIRYELEPKGRSLLAGVDTTFFWKAT